jgi:hypothetical protein
MFAMPLMAIRKSLGRIAAVMAESLAAKAAALMQCPPGNGSVDDPHSQARAYALDALQAVSGDLSQTPRDYAPLRQTLEGLGPAAAARFVQALDPHGPRSSDTINSRAQDRILVAMNAGAHTQTTGAVVQTIFARTSPGALRALPTMQQHMAKALAREWYPDDPIKRITETNRLAGIFGTDQGQQLLFGGGEDGRIALDARVNALAIIRANSSINAATLTETADPWTNMAIVGPWAQVSALQFLALRGDAPQMLRGTNLDNTVGYAMGYPPTLPPGISPAFAQSKAATATFSYYTQGPARQPVRAVVDQIRRLGGADPQVTVLPIQYSSSGAGPVRLPLFRVFTANGDGYVDNTGRSYTGLQDWKDHNQLPPGIVVFPDQGHLSSGDGGAKLDSADTPATCDTGWKQVKGETNDAMLVGGITAGGALITGTDGLATPSVAGVAVASRAWQAHTGEWLDRSQQGPSVNPPQESTARGLWLNLAADTAGIGAFASEATLARIASAEGELSLMVAWALGRAKGVANATTKAACSAAGIDLTDNGGFMTPQQRAQSILSTRFWGATIARGRGASHDEVFVPGKALAGSEWNEHIGIEAAVKAS